MLLRNLGNLEFVGFSCFSICATICLFNWRRFCVWVKHAVYRNLFFYDFTFLIILFFFFLQLYMRFLSDCGVLRAIHYHSKNFAADGFCCFVCIFFYTARQGLQTVVQVRKWVSNEMFWFELFNDGKKTKRRLLNLKLFIVYKAKWYFLIELPALQHCTTFLYVTRVNMEGWIMGGTRDGKM